MTSWAAWAKWDPAAAAPAIVAEFERTFGAGEHRVPIGPLLACAVADVRETLRETLTQARFGERTSNTTGCCATCSMRRGPNQVLVSVADELRARVADASLTTPAFPVFFRLHLAAGATVYDAGALPHFLTAALRDGITGEQFVRTVEHEANVRELQFVDPTAAEVRAAAARLAQRLRR